MRIVKVGNKIRFTFTNEEKQNITERNSLDVDLGFLKVLFDDISKIILEMLPNLRKRRK